MCQFLSWGARGGHRRGTDPGRTYVQRPGEAPSPLLEPLIPPRPQSRAKVPGRGPAWEVCCRASLPCSRSAPANFPLIWRACCRGSVGDEVVGLTPISSARAASLAAGALQSVRSVKHHQKIIRRGARSLPGSLVPLPTNSQGAPRLRLPPAPCQPAPHTHSRASSGGSVPASHRQPPRPSWHSCWQGPSQSPVKLPKRASNFSVGQSLS